MSKALLFILTLILLGSCSNQVKNEKGTKPELEIESSILFEHETVIPEQHLDTLVLRHILYACSCPDWVIPSEFDKPYSVDSTLFNSREYSFYIEPMFDMTARLNNCRNNEEYLFVGKIDSLHRYPKKFDPITPDPPKGMIFKYLYCVKL